MKKPSKIITMLLLVCGIAVIFSACTEDAYKNYVSSGLEPKTKHDVLAWANGELLAKWHSEPDLKLLTSYSDYEDYGVNLGYTAEYFDLNSLLVFLKTGCSSDNLQYVDVLENDGKLYPVVEINPYGKNDPKTEDIIYYVYYTEIPVSGNYSIGEVITRTRKHKT